MSEEFTNNQIRSYCNEIKKTPLLSREDEFNLSERIKEGDMEAVQVLIESNLLLVVKIARDYVGHGVELWDLIAEGNEGLRSAAEKYDHLKGAKFSTYAAFFIVKAITRNALNMKGKNIRIPDHMRQKASCLRRIKIELSLQNEREVTLDEISDDMGIEVARLQMMEDVTQGTFSLDQKIGEEQDSEVMDMIEDTRVSVSSEIVSNREIQVLVDQTLLSALDLREQEIIIKRFGLSDEEVYTLQALATTFNVSKERVRQLQNIALAKLRKAIDTKEQSGGHSLEVVRIVEGTSDIVKKIILNGVFTKIEGSVYQMAHTLEIGLFPECLKALSEISKRSLPLDFHVILNGLIDFLTQEFERASESAKDIYSNEFELAAKQSRKTLESLIPERSTSFFLREKQEHRMKVDKIEVEFWGQWLPKIERERVFWRYGIGGRPALKIYEFQDGAKNTILSSLMKAEEKMIFMKKNSIARFFGKYELEEIKIFTLFFQEKGTTNSLDACAKIINISFESLCQKILELGFSLGSKEFARVVSVAGKTKASLFPSDLQLERQVADLALFSYDLEFWLSYLPEREVAIYKDYLAEPGEKMSLLSLQEKYDFAHTSGPSNSLNKTKHKVREMLSDPPARFFMRIHKEADRNRLRSIFFDFKDHGIDQIAKELNCHTHNLRVTIQKYRELVGIDIFNEVELAANRTISLSWEVDTFRSNMDQRKLTQDQTKEMIDYFLKRNTTVSYKEVMSCSKKMFGVSISGSKASSFIVDHLPDVLRKKQIINSSQRSEMKSYFSNRPSATAKDLMIYAKERFGVEYNYKQAHKFLVRIRKK